MRFPARLRVALLGLLPVLLVAPGVSAQESTWAQIKARGTLRVGMTQAPPW